MILLLPLLFIGFVHGSAYHTVLSSFSPEKPARYDETLRAVSNWRGQALISLDPFAGMVLLRLHEASSGSLPRCIRLNNYWCIKAAGWRGQIAMDAENHTAFASAAEGAEAAAALLRRYYVDLKLTSARAIVARWAPISCSVMAGRFSNIIAPAGTAGPGLVLATRGIQNTVRAKWLAKQRNVRARPVRAVARTAGARAISAKGARGAVRVVAAPAPFGCPSETQRQANYAAAIALGVAESVEADLRLFDAQGQPTDHLARTMANMASVEIGPMRVRQDLVSRAIARVFPGSGTDLATLTAAQRASRGEAGVSAIARCPTSAEAVPDADNRDACRWSGRSRPAADR